MAEFSENRHISNLINMSCKVQLNAVSGDQKLNCPIYRDGIRLQHDSGKGRQLRLKGIQQIRNHSQKS